MKRVFSPYPYLVLFIFFTITSINLKVPFLREIHLELLLVIGVILFSRWQDISFRTAVWGLKERELILICGALCLSPILSSLANYQYFAILDNDEFKSWTKTLIIGPFVFWGFRTKLRRRELIDLLLFSLFIFEVIFLYRYFVLGEARTFDLRPLVHTKNGDPNFICTFLAVGIPFALYQTLAAFEQKKRPWVGVYLALAIFLLYGATVTQSRMGLISVVISLCYIIYRAPLPIRRSRLIAFGLIVLSVFVIFYGRTVSHRFATINDESSEGRLRSYVNGVKMFSDSPGLGKGWDTSPQYYFHNSGYPLFRSDPDMHSLAVHNTPLQLLADLGVYGLIFYLWLMVFVGKRIRMAILRKDKLALFSAASFLTLILNYLTLPLETKDFALMFLFILAALSVPLNPESAPKTTRPFATTSRRKGELPEGAAE